MKMGNNIVIENAKITFRNFSGAESQYNPKGRMNFAVLLDDDTASMLLNDGWNVRMTKPREDEEEGKPYLPVAVSYANMPPKIVLVTSRGKTVLTEETVHLLDYAEIETVDLTLNPYRWNVGDKSGIKAYLKSMWVTIVEDELEHKYRGLPDTAGDGE
jgi:hypothetical protein